MKLLSKILALTLVLAAVSCSRKVVVASSHTTLHQDSTVKAIDTSKITEVEHTKEVVDYGDTLSGSLYIPADTTVFVDSIESKGVKISVTVNPVKGGFKARLNAISKPKQTTHETTKTTTQQQGKSTEANKSTEQETEAKDKATDSTKLNAAFWVFVLIVFGVVAYLVKRTKDE